MSIATLVNFAMDLEEVYMTTKLDGQATFFLPFNMGNGHGVTAGAGNPAFKDKYSVSYMWEDILTKDTILDLISKFIFVEVKEKVDEETGKVKRSENLIFPRYHQLDVIRKILADVRENGTAQNYLIQHSAGSGKTNSIAWLAHRLTSLHDAHNKIIFDNVVIVTDRVVVDRQLQKAIMGMEHKAGLIRVMDDKCVSADLAIALNGNTKIIATTIQKFPYIVDSVANLKNKRFAVIIDEAHSSTAGKDMAAITMTLGSGEDTEADVEDMISSEIKRNGKQANVSMFAFTATPKPTTIQLFGHQNTKGQKEAFHVYSMKQAIEEGFILDVLQNYTEYSTFYQINKEIEDDPRCKTNDAKRQIARFIELHDTNIAQRVEVIVEHFRTTVMQELGGQAKAMVITASRQSAVKYRQAFEDYIAKKGYEGIHALVAFSGKVKLPDDELEYTESSLNGFPEDRLTKEFDTDKYQVLLVANKYQTGFDQPKLCAMLRDAADETEDMKIVEQFDISAIDTESLKGFRNHHKSYRPEHVFNNLPDDEYLERIGAAGFGEDGKLHPTTAGLLMFGEEYHIVREFPEYFLDYREMLDPTIRWTDRLQSSSGDWSGNVFDFFFRVNSKIAKDIKKPFKLEGITRVDDTPVHKAVREALVNCLVNTDYFLPCGVVIKKEDDKLVIENPGSIRTGKKQMLRGGISDPRNKTLMKMFNMIGIGERAGSGIPDIYQVWENEGWPMPVVEESYNPDRTRLSLEFAKKQTIKTSEEEKEPKRSQKGAEKEPIKGAERKKEILKLIKVNSTITQVEIMKELDLTRKQVQKDMKELQEMHIIAREGTNRRGRWIIVKENK